MNPQRAEVETLRDSICSTLNDLNTNIKDKSEEYLNQTKTPQGVWKMRVILNEINSMTDRLKSITEINFDFLKH